MRIDLLELNETFARFAELHEQIQTYVVMTDSEDPKAGNRKYPLMWMQLTDDIVLDRNAASLGLTFLFLDKVMPDDSNLLFVLNDCLNLVQDFRDFFDENEEKFKFTIDTDATATPILIDYDDRLAGYSLSVTLDIQSNRDERVIPMQPWT